MMNTPPDFVSLHALAVETGSAARHIERWLRAHGVTAKRSGGRLLFERQAALAVIRAHQRPHTADGDGDRGLAPLVRDWATTQRRLAVLEGLVGLIRQYALDMSQSVIDMTPGGPAAEPPPAPPQFTPVQCAWLIQALENQISAFRIMAPEKEQS